MDYMMKKKNILVVGDAMLDTYYYGIVNRISPEAPVPVFRKESERYVPGGAANVAANLIAAGQEVSVMTVIGEDGSGDKLLAQFTAMGIHTELVCRAGRHTTAKVRFIAGNHQQVMRLDEEDTYPISEKECGRLLNLLGKKMHSFDLVLISDYCKGLLTHQFTQGVLGLARKHGVKVFIDVKDPDLDKYRGAYLLKPNQKELHELTGMPVDAEREIVEASRTLLKKCGSQYVLTTLGAEGMCLVSKEDAFSVKSTVKEVFDVTGAGDTAISYLAAYAANGVDIKAAVELSNYAAGLQVSKTGTSVVYAEEVHEAVRSGKQGILHKLVSRDTAAELRRKHDKKKIVFTNGCFDILHVGHIRYLEEASKLGDILVVGLNSDDSVKALKGPGRPVNTQTERAELLCALEYVDYVVIFEEDTPYELIKQIQPDVLVKGADYKPEEVVGRDIVEAGGGTLRLIPLVDGKSTTGMIRRLHCSQMERTGLTGRK